MCTGSGLIAGVAGARLTYAECPVSGTSMHAGSITVCARPVPACRVRSCGVGGRRESERRPGCREAVPGTAGGRRPLVVLLEAGRNWGVCYRVVAWRAGRLCRSSVLLLFLQKQNLATDIYLFGLGTLLTGLGLKHMRIRSHHDLASALVTSLLLGRPWWSTTSPTCLPLSVFTITSDQH